MHTDIIGLATEGLNEEQCAAATHGDGPLLIVAGAGTGKTTALAHRVAVLIARGVDPGRILLLTFTRRAAVEMLRRAEGALHEIGTAGVHGSGSRVWGGTFHSAAARLLRMHAREIGLEPDFTILDRGDSEDLMHVCRTDLALGSGAKRFPQKSTCLDIYSRCVNAQEPLEDVLRTRYPWCRHAEEGLAQLFGAYTDAKDLQRVLDYDDLLLFLRGMLADEASASLVRQRFDHVLVDEYQDTNALQADIVAMLRPDSTGITAVGDDDQSIYGFRAATVRNILDFERRHPGATVLTLEHNYRSSESILSAVNAIMAEADERREKALWTTRNGGGRPSLVSCRDEPEQSDWVIDRVLEHREQGVPLRRQAVLFRALHHSMALELELSRRSVPFRKYGGLRFIETAHVKDLTSFLRLAQNPMDSMAALRVMGLVPGIGPKTASRLSGALSASGGDFACLLAEKVPETSEAQWRSLVSLMRSLSASDSDVPAQVHAIRTVYEPLMERRYDYVQARQRDLEQLEGIAGGCADRTAFLSELALDPPSWAGELAGPPVLDEDWLVLSTIHSAKGLEYDVVYVIHAADGNIPSDMSTGSPAEIDEERRLFYVACTRARDHLYVTHPLRYYKAGSAMSDSYGYAQRTRFLTERVLPHFVSVQAGPEPVAADEPSSGRQRGVSIRDGVRGLWG